jgi:hypothetical protein
MKAYGGVTSVLAGGVWLALSPEKEPLVPIGWEVEWAPEPVWTTWKNKNS